MPSAERRRLPQSLGRYHVIEELESDALGRLSFARFEGPSGFQRWATLRTLEGPLTKDAELVAAFHVAARALACIQHPNVASPFEAGDESERPPWMAFEYVYGERVESIATSVRRRQVALPWEIAARIVADAALGVHALRDVGRPGPASRHLLVGFDGRTRILEGCLSVPDDGGDPAALATRLKKAWREPADPADDVLRLGMILRTLTNETAPASLLLIVRRAVARVPTERQRSPRHLARDIDALLASARLVVTADDVARFMRQVFPDRMERHDARLKAAQHTTEVFRRKAVSIELTDADFEEIAADVGPDTIREGQGFVDYHDSGDTMLMPTAVWRRRSRKLQGARRHLPPEPVKPVSGVPTTEPMELPPLPAPPRLPASLAPRAPARPSWASASKRPSPLDSDVGVYAPTFDAPAKYTAPAPAVVRSVAPPANALQPARSPLGLSIAMVLVACFAAAAFWFTRLHPDAVARLLGATRVTASHTPALPVGTTAAAPPPATPAAVPPATPSAAPPAPASASASHGPPAVDVLSLPEAPAPTTGRGARKPGARAVIRRAAPVAPAAEDAAQDEPAMGSLTVVCVPACDEVLDGGRSLGPSPVFKVPAAAGAHTLTLQADDDRKSVSVTVKPDQVSYVRVEFP